jgi:lysophospholipase L1-like esterase
MDAHANFPYSHVATAPSPAVSGLSLVLTAGDGAILPTPVPFNGVIWPNGAVPTIANAEIVRVTAVSTDTLTIVRAQEGTSARTIVVGDQFAAPITKKTLTDIEDAFLFPNGITINSIQMWIAAQNERALRRFREAMATASTTPLVALFFGDSITEGVGVPGPYDRYVKDISDAIATAVGRPNSSPGYLCAKPAFGGGADLWTGDVGTLGANGIGLRSWKSATGVTNFHEVIVDNCTGFWLYYNKDPSYGAFEIRIDGVLTVTLDSYQVSGLSAARWDSAALSRGTHTIRVTSINTGSARPTATFGIDIAGVLPLDGNSTLGVQLFNGGHSGFPSWSPTAIELAHVVLIDPDIIFLGYGANDPAFLKTPANTRATFELAFDALTAAIAHPVSIVFAITWGTQVEATWEPYVAQLFNSAVGKGAALVNWYAALGHQDTAGTVLSGGGGHPNVAGSLAYRDVAINELGIVPARPALRESTITSSATWSPNADTTTLFIVTGQSVAVTTISNPSGSPTDGQLLTMRFEDDGTSRTLAWTGSKWRQLLGTILPTVTVVGTTMYCDFRYNAFDDKWDLVRGARMYDGAFIDFLLAFKSGLNPLATDSLWAAKGDIVSATGNNAAAVTTVGAFGTVAKADSTLAGNLIYGFPDPLTTHYIKPTGSYETVSRSGLATQTATGTAVVALYAIGLPKNFLVTSISFFSASASAVTPTHWWFSLCNSSYVTLRSTADQTTTAWSANTEKNLNLSSTFTTTYEGLHYLAFMMAAATVINFPGVQLGGAPLTTILPLPAVTGISGQSTAPADGTNLATSPVGKASIAYAYVK